MSKWWSDHIAALQPYVPGEQPKTGSYIRLNTNEACYPPSPKVLEAIASGIGEKLRFYPNIESDAVRKAAADFYGIQDSQVIVSNGSDDTLSLIFQAYFKHGQKKVLTPEISYSFYPVYANLYGIDLAYVPLRDDFSLDLTPYIQANPNDYAGIIIANPNAPTSLAISLEEIERLLKAQPDLPVVIDEAYVDFGAQSSVSLIQQYPNLIVVQTLSKSRALAGMRVGFAFAQENTLEAMYRLKNSTNSFPVDTLAQLAAVAAWEDVTYFQETTCQVQENRDFLTQEMKGLGFKVLDSKANFIFATHPDYPAALLQEKLKEQFILVRYFNRPKIDRYLRITIGTRFECETLIQALNNILK
ncbi:histidinol-phosphate transaminase [Basilea psittacipulmonis]|uniref:Histidinol-phosphate aminotransferase n=1 Tax=Basilea psittacipulmonis DSM 24701 TaxID=1072685 RepID=A0A077DDG5_9BURK|nr:histidinol-phosphate transaminase [Basilea psittacipulmonis]AIL32659.1 histidinol-phosphate aminotransferase [Basilea psittacipulmonis DSM 24701]